MNELEADKDFILRWIKTLPWGDPLERWLWGEYEVLLHMLMEYTYINPAKYDLWFYGHRMLAASAITGNVGDWEYIGAFDGWDVVFSLWLEQEKEAA